jgi:hypothetical protein
LQAHFDGLPWSSWAAWLLGLGLLAAGRRSAAPEQVEQIPTPPGVKRSRRGPWLMAGVATLLLLVGGYARMSQLLPPSIGLSQFPYDDEGVYAGASQFFLQGILPYRDYFFAHPPLAAISYAPAMAYHFTEWGSPTSFMDARYLSVAYSLATLVLLVLIGWRLANVWGGVIAGWLWALDGRVIEINRKVMLDGPMVLLSCGALLLYLWARPRLAGEVAAGGPRRLTLALFFTGVLAGMSALTKIAGVACLLAILADLLWLHFEIRRGDEIAPSLWRRVAVVLGGALAAFVVFAVPFMLAAPSRFLREVVFFQLLRPSDGLIDVPARIADISATYTNALTPLFAALGFAAVSVCAILQSPNRQGPELKTQNSKLKTPSLPWRAVVLWTLFSVLLFTYSRSFYGHYYIQLAAPLCLLGAGVGYLPGLMRDLPGRLAGRGLAGYVTAALLIVVALPLSLVEWNGANSRHEDRIFEIVGRYVSDAVPPGAPVLSTDEQFDFLAARPPSRNATGYLVDSYGHMIFHGLGLDARDWGDLLGASLRGDHSNDVYAVIHLPAAQADFLDRASKAQLIVIHQKGLPRLTQQTIATIEQQYQVVVREPRYTIYRGK